jgi:hypothetical protein
VNDAFEFSQFHAADHGRRRVVLEARSVAASRFTLVGVDPV